MKIKHIAIAIISLILLLLGIKKIDISNNNLQSLFLTTCHVNIIEEEKENYRKTLAQIKILQNYISSSKCSSVEQNSSLGITCKWLQKDLEDKKDTQKKYEDCYWDLEKQGKIKKEESLHDTPVNITSFNTRQFIDPVLTCKAPKNYQSVTIFNNDINPSNISGTVIGKSFDGSWYQKVRLVKGNYTIIKRTINNKKQIEIDDSFIFLSGNLENVGDIHSVQEYGDGSIYAIYESIQNQNLTLVQIDKKGQIIRNAIDLETKIGARFGIHNNFNLSPAFFTQNKRVMVTGDNSQNNNHESLLYFLDLQTFKKEFLNQQALFRGPITIAGQQPDGKIIYKEGANLKRMNPNGTPDNSLQSPKYGYDQAKSTKCPYIENLKVFSDGSIIVSGNFTEVNKTARNCFARLLPNGELDFNFNPEEGFSMTGSNLFVDYDGQNNIIVYGQFDSYRGVKQKNFIVLNKNGEVNKNIAYNIRENELAAVGNQNSNINISSNNSILLSGGLLAIIGENITENGSCNEDVQTITSNNAASVTCNKDDFEKGTYIFNQKIYVPSQDAINVYSLESLQLIKKIQRGSSLIPSWGLQYNLMNSGVKIGKNLYIGSQLGVDVIDMETDTWVKTLGHHKPDVSPSIQGALPADTLTTFQYNGETYVIRSDHMVYKVEGSKPTTIEEKYTTLTPTSGGSIPNDHSLTESISTMGQIGSNIYAIGRSRLLVIDPQTQKVIQEIKYDVSPYRGLSFNKEQESYHNGPLITSPGKLYIPTSKGYEAQEKAKKARWIIIDTNTLKVIKILENLPESDPYNDKINKGICPAVPLSPRSIFLDKGMIYMSFIDQPQLQLGDIKKCDIMVLDIENDTFSSVNNVSEKILYELQLAKNANFLSRVSFEYGQGYIIPKDGENYYNVYDKDSGYKKINTIGGPFLSWLQPMSQKEGKIYYGLYSEKIQMLDLTQTGITCSEK